MALEAIELIIKEKGQSEDGKRHHSTSLMNAHNMSSISTNNVA